MEEILKLWEEICKERNCQEESKMNLANIIGFLGEAYYLKQAREEKIPIENFIEKLYNMQSFLDKIKGIADKEFVATCIRAGVYKMEFLERVRPVCEDKIIQNDRKEEKIFREFIFENSNDLYNLEKVMGLSFILGKEVKEVAKQIGEYEEEIEDIYDCWSEEE